MSDLSTTFMGLLLKNPIIIGSCGLTSSVDKIKELELNGAAAVVLKSIFEEEILLKVRYLIDSAKKNQLIYSDLSETFDYIDLHTRTDVLDNYLDLIRKCKKEVLIPVIASINCVTDSEWTDFAVRIEEAGADGIELNIYLNPFDNSNENFEERYIKIISNVLTKVKIPVSVKLGQNFTKPYMFFTQVSETGIKGMVLFNRFYQPDIDIEDLILKEASIISSPCEFNQTLKWIGILSDRVRCSLAASTGIHDSQTLIKQILAGSDAVQLVSAIYKSGPQIVSRILSELEDWMDKKGYNYIGQFKGMLKMTKGSQPSAYERIQFMKYFGGIK